MEAKGLKAAAQAEPAKTAEDEPDLDGFEYRVILHTGQIIEVISKQEPAKLAAAWQRARKNDEVVAWNGDQFTEARQVAHLESVLDEEETTDGKQGGEEAGGEGGGEGEKEKPAGIAAAAAAADGGARG